VALNVWEFERAAPSIGLSDAARATSREVAPFLDGYAGAFFLGGPLESEKLKNQIDCRQLLMKGWPCWKRRLSARPYPCCFKEDMAMATSYDYAPLFRSSVGFDRIFDLLENAQRTRSISDWPPYDIVKTGEDSYRISIAVAGFAEEDLDITFRSNLLMVTGKQHEAATDGYLHHGIVGRPFEHRFELADHVRVSGADLNNGLLSINLVREIPEELKPRKISIQSAPALTSPASTAQIEARNAA
jgi:molecular chaperone IbpA